VIAALRPGRTQLESQTVIHALVLSVGFGAITFSVLALAAVGVTLQYGVTNYINFAYGAYIALAAYIAWIANVKLGINIWLAIAISAVVMGPFSVVVSRAILQPFARRNLPPVYLLMVTVGLNLVVTNAIVVVFGPDVKGFTVADETPANIGPFLFTTSQLLIIAISVATLSSVHLLLRRTRIGKAMRAMSDDIQLAQVSGIDADVIVTFTWLLSGCLVGLSGCVLAVNFASFAPWFGNDFLFVIFSAVILGGVGQPYGTMLGALIIGMATEVSAAVIAPSYKGDIAFVVLIIVIFFRPQGLIPARGRH
jgi:branched-subunit amino acid ABC-type transport system permease component